MGGFRSTLVRRGLIALAFGLTLVSNAFGQATNQSLVISSASAKQAMSGSIITLAVDGMAPNGSIVVIFFKPRAFRRGVNSEVTAPGFSPDGRNVQAAVPFFLTGPVRIQVLEDTASGELSSNYFSPLRILPAPAARAKPGTVTLSFLEGDSQILQAARQFVSPGSPVTLQADLGDEIAVTRNAIACVRGFLQRPSQPCQVETVEGTAINLSAAALRLADRAILGYVNAQSNADPAGSNTTATDYVHAFTKAAPPEQRQAATSAYFNDAANSFARTAAADGSPASSASVRNAEALFRTNALIDNGVVFTAALYTNTPLLAQTLAAAALSGIAYAGYAASSAMALADGAGGNALLSGEVVNDLSFESFAQTVADSTSGIAFSANRSMFAIFAALIQQLTTTAPTPAPAPSTPVLPSPTPRSKRPTPTPLISPSPRPAPSSITAATPSPAGPPSTTPTPTTPTTPFPATPTPVTPTPVTPTPATPSPSQASPNPTPRGKPPTSTPQPASPSPFPPTPAAPSPFPPTPTAAPTLTAMPQPSPAGGSSTTVSPSPAAATPTSSPMPTPAIVGKGKGHKPHKGGET